MAITKKKKEEILEAYQRWLNESQAVIMTEYHNLTMKDLDTLRAKLRDVGAEFHIVKNTLGKLAAEKAGFVVEEEHFVGPTAMGFAFEDPPAMAKVITEFANATDLMKIKGGYLGKTLVDAKQVKALAELPPLPVMRSWLMGTILAPATQLARLMREPARQIAVVVKAHSEAEATA